MGTRVKDFPAVVDDGRARQQPAASRNGGIAASVGRGPLGKFSPGLRELRQCDSRNWRLRVLLFKISSNAL